MDLTPGRAAPQRTQGSVGGPAGRSCDGTLMIGFGDDDGWAEDLESWEELADLLRSDWDRVEHAPGVVARTG